MIETPTDLAGCALLSTWLSLSATLDFIPGLTWKPFKKNSKMWSLTVNLCQICKVQKPGPRPTALAWLWLSKTQARPKPIPGQRSGPAWLGPAWPGFWPQAGAGTSLPQSVTPGLALTNDVG